MKIAILGASEPHLPIYLKAKEMGMETYCIAWKEGAFCKDYADHFYDISIVDKEVIAELCLNEGIDGIISNALEMAVPTMAYVSEKCGFNGISYKAALRATNKKAMRQRIFELDACPQPYFCILRNMDTTAITYPIIVKPTDSSCSNGVTKVNSQEELSKAIDRAIKASVSQEVLIEQFIEGREVSVESISFHGIHHVLTITDKETTSAPFFVETAHHQPSNLPDDVQKALKLYVTNILNALEITNGASHAEFKIDSLGNIFFIEIGARGGGDFISYDLVRLSTGYDYVKGMIEVALNTFEEPKITKQKYSGVYFLGKETAYVADFISINKDQSWVINSQIDNIPLRTLTRSQDRSGYIIYQSDSRIIISKK